MFHERSGGPQGPVSKRHLILLVHRREVRMKYRLVALAGVLAALLHTAGASWKIG
jgi:hypothetical protein